MKNFTNTLDRIEFWLEKHFDTPYKRTWLVAGIIVVTTIVFYSVLGLFHYIF